MSEKTYDVLTKKWVPLESESKEDYSSLRIQAGYAANQKAEDEFWERFSRSLAHEIKNPLVSISTYAQLLPGHYNDPQFRGEFLEKVGSDIRKLNEFVEKLIAIASPLELDLRSNDVERVIGETLSSLREANYPQGVLIDWQADKLPLISFDFDKLKEALRSICINAVEAMPMGGTLGVRASLIDKELIELRFQDTGQGITLENISRIFSPFFSTKDGHSGLGLTLAKKIIAAHRGSIELKNEPGSGAVFSVFLPACKAGAGNE